MEQIYQQKLTLFDKNDIDTVRNRLVRLSNSICYNSKANGLQTVILFDNQQISQEDLENALVVLSKLVNAPTNDDYMPYILK